ncbi:M20/M25/M40 family metallo-hydrolase [Hymenobacter properus]|uniref:M20/M25/M40 family metallo-hydrolase n=1 Tax=Hymenobacter properus TaxID=2791026 RepID=A0A931BD62_9BACT|nr:M20/M25/M40 family metallo-hydrolase [Hymenobacter properus]MBF9140421.1 M20/M25/M40 family metallo-hydrolase [Hymenobacter properus]MBR7719228.1 M20/M25/M40 family metallo-hydrolase [Microvirga sp. SRT04]
MKQLLLLGALLATLPAVAQKKAAKPAPKTATVSAATVSRVVNALAADDMQGRGTGQAGGAKAAQFLAAEFKRIGLKPLPGQTGFEQNFTLYKSQPGPTTVVLNGQTVDSKQVMMAGGLTSLNWTSEDAKPVEVVRVAPGEKAKLGRLLHPTANTLVIVDTTHTRELAGLANYLRQGTMSAEAPQPFATVIVLATVPPAVTYRISATSAVLPLEQRNVVGMLPGRDPKRSKENVVFAGHYDHLGILKPTTAGDSIANGADDDASGTTAVVALAEYFKKKNDSARPLIFAAFAAEEVGGFGSQYFSKQLDPQQVVAMFNIEMIGKEAKFGPNTAFITGYERSDFGKLLQANLAGSKFRFEPDPYPEQNLFYRSDNATLARLGVPAHTISTDQIPTDGLYHSVDDEVETLNLANMTAVIQAIAQSATGIVSGKQTPTRIPPLTDDK